jgi:MFS family permease
MCAVPAQSANAGERAAGGLMRLPFFYGWVIVAVTFVTMAVGVNARTAFSLLFPPILEEFGWDRGVTAGAFSFGFVVAAVLSPFLGRLMDRRGPRLVMEAGSLALAAGLMLAAVSSEPWHFYVSLGVLVGGGSVCLGYSGQALFLPNWFVRRRGLAISMAYAGAGVGSILLLPAVALLIADHDWRTACWAMALLVLALLVPLNLLLRHRPEDLGLEPDGDAAPPVGAAPTPHANIVDAAWTAIDWTLARALRTARFWWLALGYGMALYAWYAVQVHQTKYLLEIGFAGETAAWALGLVGFAGIPGQIALGHLSDRIGREWVWSAGCLGFALCYGLLLLLAEWPSPALLYAMILAQGLLGYGITSVFGAIPAEIFQGRHYGQIFGSLSLAGVAGGALAPWLTGLIFDLTGRYTLAFWLAMLLCVVSALAIWMAAPRRVRRVAGRIPKSA